MWLTMATSVASSVMLAAITAIVGWMARKVRKMAVEHEALILSQRNQLKTSIVRSYEEAEERGFFTALELETLNRRADSYYELGGNNYIHALMSRANSMPIRGGTFRNRKEQQWKASTYCPTKRTTP